jgi:hypothetical protein
MNIANDAALEAHTTSPGGRWSIPDLTGDNYEMVLDRFHRILAPKTYLEIGVNRGATLRLSRCPSIAVDPVFLLDNASIKDKKITMFFEITSDEFFARFSPTTLFGQPVDMAFLDGMHLYEFLLRDFINTERFCKPNSVIFLHDCIPPDEHVARRVMAAEGDSATSLHPEWWTGDVWKAVSILKKYRPELRIYGFDALPTGLIAITNLNPSSSTLAERYFEIVEEYRTVTLQEEGQRYLESLAVLSTRDTYAMEDIATRFWL